MAGSDAAGAAAEFIETYTISPTAKDSLLWAVA
jgi:hypothetical protein